MKRGVRSAGKWSIPYQKLGVKKFNGVPLNIGHEYLLQASFEGIWEWEDWFTQREVPFATLELPDGRWAMWKHRWTAISPSAMSRFRKSSVPTSALLYPGKFCCGAEA